VPVWKEKEDKETLYPANQKPRVNKIDYEKRTLINGFKLPDL
jgi:hypothetical protein